jgi:hypothetical protein
MNTFHSSFDYFNTAMSVDNVPNNDDDAMSVDETYEISDIYTSDIPMELDITEDLAFRMYVDLNDTTPNVPFMTRYDYIQKLRESRPLTLAEFKIASQCNYFTNIRLNCIDRNFDNYSKQYLPEQYCFNDCNCFRQFFFSGENNNDLIPRMYLEYKNIDKDTLNEKAMMHWSELTDQTPLVCSNSVFEFEQRLRENRPLTFEEFILTLQCEYFSNLRLNCIKNNFNYATTHIHQKTYHCANTCVCNSMAL